jgi:hypothetical protein
MPILEGKFGEHGLFFPYYKNLLEKDWSNILLTNNTIIDRVFHGFFDKLAADVEEPIVGVDIKIDQLDIFPRLYWTMQEMEFRVIHLIRRNYLARIISHLIMNQRVSAGEVHIHSEKQQKTSITVDANQVVWWMVQDLERNQKVEQIFSASKERYLQVFYEEIVSENANMYLEPVLEFVGSKHSGVISTNTIRQATEPLADVIKNYDEVTAEIERRGLREQLRASI